MPSLAERLQLLARAPLASAADILAAALDHAEDGECVPIARRLVDLQQTIGLQAVVRNLHRLGGEGEQVIKTSRVSFLRPASQALESDDRQAVLNVINLALARLDWRLLPLLARFLMSRHDGVPDRAASALLAIVVARVGENGRIAPPHPVAAAIDSALAEAAGGYRRHRLDDVLCEALSSTPIVHWSGAT